MGQNIGTCITAIIASLSSGRQAKRVALCHAAVNILGSAVCFVPYLFIPTGNVTATPAVIALLHTAFNVISFIVLMPFAGFIERLICRLIPEKGVGDSSNDIGFDLLPPSVTVSECMTYTVRLAHLTADTVKLAASGTKSETVEKNEQTSDRYEDILRTALCRIAKSPLSYADSLKVSRMLYTISDLERICDHALHISKSDNGFSPTAKNELTVLSGAVCETVDTAVRAFSENDAQLAFHTEPAEQVIDALIAKIRRRHIERLRNGECKPENGLHFSDLLVDFERISDHCSNISAAVIELKRGSFETHRYLKNVKKHDQSFTRLYKSFDKKYRI